MKRVYMIVNSIEENKGGMTTAILNRSKVFYNNSISADIITFDYNLDYGNVSSNLKSIGKMHKHTKIYNMFMHFEKKSRKRQFLSKPSNEHNKLIKELGQLIEVSSNDTSSRYYSKVSGEYLFLVRYKENAILHIDFYNNNKRFKRVYFKNKVIRLIELFNQDNRKINEVFYNEYEQPYLNRTIHPKTENIMNITLLHEKKRFNNNREFARYFIDDLLDEKNDNTLICDGPRSFFRMIGLKTKDVKKIAVIHTNHFRKPYKYGSPVKNAEKKILENASKVDNIIVFTEKQKKDILKQFKINNVEVIPNFQIISKVEKKHKKGKVVGTISRLHKDKGFDRLLKVAQLVNKKDCSIEFHIYGVGPYRKDIANNITKLNLENIVKLKGYTNNVKETLSTFDVTVSTSYFEAFGLSITESMEQEVPVVAMDINYGPSDLIENDKNGYLISDNDIETMANRVIELVNDQNKNKKLGKNAREKVLKDLNPKSLVRKWKTIL